MRILRVLSATALAWINDNVYWERWQNNIDCCICIDYRCSERIAEGMTDDGLHYGKDYRFI